MAEYMEDTLGLSYQDYEMAYAAKYKDDGEAEDLDEFRINGGIALGAVLILASGLFGILSLEIPPCAFLAEACFGAGLIGCGAAQESDEREKRRNGQ